MATEEENNTEEEQSEETSEQDLGEFFDDLGTDEEDSDPNEGEEEEEESQDEEDEDPDEDEEDDDSDEEEPEDEEEEEDDPSSDLIKEVKALRAEVAKLRGASDDDDTSNGEPQVTLQSVEEELDALDDDAFDALTDDREKFVDFMKGVLKKTAIASTEQALRRLPEVAKKLSKQSTQLQTLRNRFYSANKDLSKHKEVVALVANKIAAEDPNASVEDVLKKTAPRVRKMLGLKKEASGKGPRTGKSGKRSKRFAGGSGTRRGGSRRAKPKSNSAQAQIDEMFDLGV
jgi:hypothetical protein